MKRVPALAVLLFVVGWVCGGWSWSTSVRGAEPAREFLDALRSARYYDSALEYLEVLATSPLTPASMREVLAYERAVTLIQGSKQQRDAQLREKNLDEAQVALNEFVAQMPDHNLNTSARLQLANVMFERALFRTERAKRPAEVANRDKLRGEAKEFFTQAQKTYQAIEADLKTKLQGVPASLDENKDKKEYDRVKQMRDDYLTVQLLVPAVIEESADAFGKEAPEYKATLTNAAKLYGELFNKYRKRLAGLRARTYQGRALQKMGDLKEAIGIYNELLDTVPEDGEDVHELRTEIVLMACTAWMHESQKKYAEVIERGGKAIEKAYPTEMRSPEMMELRLTVARASKAYSDQIKQEKPKDPLVNGLLADARKLAQVVARFPGDYQKDAQKFLGEIGGKAAVATQQADPKTFDEARKAGREILETVQEARANVDNLQMQIKEQKDPEAKKKLQQELADAEQTIKNGQGDALRLFELAQRLVDKETGVEDLSSVRYHLCFLNYVLQNYEEAAVIGEFVAQRYPETAGARQSGRIAMYSFLKLYSDAKTEALPRIDALLGEFDTDNDKRLSAEEISKMPDERRSQLAEADVDKNGKIDQAELVRIATRYEAQRVMDTCSYLTKQWPDQPEAQEALGNLIAFLIGEHELDRAQEYLNKIPEDSPQRGAGELKLGRATWAAYLQGMNAVREQKQNAPPGVAPPADLAAKEAELKAYRERAQKTLVDGVGRMEKAGQVDNTFALASIALAQLYLDTDQAAKAVELMEKPKVGPLALVQAKDASVSQPGYAEDIYKTALRCYVSALSGAAADPKAGEALIKKAEEAMEGLKASVGEGEDGQKRLFAVFVSLARDLEQQMKLASDDSKKTLGKGFETFLTQVRSTAKTINELYWVATTFYSMGEGYGRTSTGDVPADAKRFFAEAAKSYDEILERNKKGTLALEPAMVTQIAMSLGKTQREVGDYEGAIKRFTQILEKSPGALVTQVEAAKTFELWGERSGEAKHFVSAIQGTRENASQLNKIWGWNEIARKTAGKPEFRDTFYDARYHVCLSRYKYALAQKEADKKKRELENAEKALASTYAAYPNMDGNPAENKKSHREVYEGLARAIQKALGKKEVGLSAYELKVPAAAGTPAGAPAAAAATGAAATPAANVAKPNTK